MKSSFFWRCVFLYKSFRKKLFSIIFVGDVRSLNAKVVGDMLTLLFFWQWGKYLVWSFGVVVFFHIFCKTNIPKVDILFFAFTVSVAYSIHFPILGNLEQCVKVMVLQCILKQFFKSLVHAISVNFWILTVRSDVIYHFVSF